MDMSANVTRRWVEHVQVKGWTERTAFHADGREWTYAEMFESAAKVAAGYRSRNLPAGARVALALPDGVQMVWCLLGAWQAGLVAVPVNVQMSRDDLIRDVTTTEPALIVVDPDIAGAFDSTRPAAIVEVESLMDKEPDGEYTASGEDAALAVFTSGTTGAPKLCFIRHQDISAPSGPGLLAGPDTVGLATASMCSTSGLYASVFTTFEAGQTAVLSRQRLSPSAAVELIRRHGVTIVIAPPSLLARVLFEPGHAEVLGEVRQVFSVGEVLSPALRGRLLPVLGPKLVNLYGSTEVGMIAVGPVAAFGTSSAVGPPLPGRAVRVVDAYDRELPIGDSGELHVRVPLATRGVTRGSVGPDIALDTWWRTGDLASLDEHGVVHVYGRIDDIEVVGGKNVDPSEIERLLQTHPRVLEAAVTSVRREAGDTSLRAHVVPFGEAIPEDGGRVDSEDKLVEELMELLSSKLSWYKVPEDVVWVKALPRNANGKLLRHALRAMS
ncbi:class I adenylate-forming enzyme family protein [Amycolatopsis thailandensis]|uniref:class I adenylate-forming enzyme family protein n=1 Tax=Amycolatopsis thailandensis TaxID=589330 RepID=UPI003645812F